MKKKRFLKVYGNPFFQIKVRSNNCVVWLQIWIPLVEKLKHFSEATKILSTLCTVEIFSLKVDYSWLKKKRTSLLGL